MDKTSLLYWFPLAQSTGVPVPETKIVELTCKHEELMPLCDGNTGPIKAQLDEIYAAAESLGYPVFMRTDYFSGKHQWNDTCFVESKEKLLPNLMRLIEASFTCDLFGLPINALVFRRYIPMKTLFHAFPHTPINPEIRFFIKDGEIECHHWYWVDDAIQEPDKEDWKDHMAFAKSIVKFDMPKLAKMVHRIAQKVPGAWSVDMCQAADNSWYMIDMANAEESFHPPHVEDEFKGSPVPPPVVRLAKAIEEKGLKIVYNKEEKQ